jgi:hypothetical protein
MEHVFHDQFCFCNVLKRSGIYIIIRLWDYHKFASAIFWKVCMVELANFTIIIQRRSLIGYMIVEFKLVLANCGNALKLYTFKAPIFGTVHKIEAAH